MTVTSKQNWKEVDKSSINSGIRSYRLDSWRAYGDFIDQKVNSADYIFRGHSNKTWKLEPTFNRFFEKSGDDYHTKRDIHLQAFMNYSKARLRFEHHFQLQTKEDWWALGQHHGLLTPLLDWTESPFIAAYFAFAKENSITSPPNDRVVYCISNEFITNHSRGYISIVRSNSDVNPRLINQRGLFTFINGKHDIEYNIQNNFKSGKMEIPLYKIYIPATDSDRLEFLTFLNRMNINHLTLFPDLIGASQYCNIKLEIDGY